MVHIWYTDPKQASFEAKDQSEDRKAMEGRMWQMHKQLND